MKKNRCQGCEIILGGLVQSSAENPNRCDDCLHFEDRIKKVCSCGREIFDRYPIKYYLQHGNFCSKCFKEVNWALKNKKHREPSLIRS